MTEKSKHSPNDGRFIGIVKITAVIAVLCILLFSAALKGIEVYQVANAPTETPVPTATPIPTATAEPVYESLRINQFGAEATVCSREEIAPMYQQFNDRLAGLAAARQVVDMSTLVAWRRKGDYGLGGSPNCGEVWFLIYFVENALMSNALHAAAGLETHIVAEAILPEMQAGIAADLTAMAESEAAWLWIEQVLDQTHLCTDREALLSYDSTRPYKRIRSGLADVHDSASLRKWLTQFDDWLSTYAAPFYNGGCHGGLMLASYYENEMYSYFFDQIIFGSFTIHNWREQELNEKLDRMAIAGR